MAGMGRAGRTRRREEVVPGLRIVAPRYSRSHMTAYAEEAAVYDIAELQPVGEANWRYRPAWPTVAVIRPSSLSAGDASARVTVPVTWSDGRNVYGMGPGLLVELDLPTRPVCTTPSDDTVRPGSREPATGATVLMELSGEVSVRVFGERRRGLHPPAGLVELLASAVTEALADRREHLVAECTRQHQLALDADLTCRIASTLSDVEDKLAYLVACRLELLANRARLTGRSMRAETIEALARTWEGTLDDALVVIEQLAPP